MNQTEVVSKIEEMLLHPREVSEVAQQWSRGSGARGKDKLQDGQTATMCCSARGRTTILTSTL
ncbi:MAG: hypothetical protein ACOC5T_02750 [Elusimicrobiota bacterium]